MTITKIRKRDGRVVDFDSNRIKDAIHKASHALHAVKTSEVNRLGKRKLLRNRTSWRPARA